jgi:hypothetical protein
MNPNWVAEHLHPFVRAQIAMWLDEYPHENPRSSCFACRRPYKSVDDFLDRRPRAGFGFGKLDQDDQFVDDACWEKYVEARGHRRRPAP